MKKRIPLLLVAVFALTVVMSGCNLFITDKNAYYNQTIASVTVPNGQTSTTITITKEELMQAHNRYYQTLSQNGYSGQALIDYLVDFLIDQKLVINQTKNMIAEGDITLTNADKNEIYNQTYENMIGLLQDYESDVADDWKIPQPSAPDADENTEDGFKEFEPEAKIVKVLNSSTNQYEWKIQIIDNTEDVEKPLAYNAEKGVVNTVVEKIDAYTEGSKVATEAKKRYIYDLKNYQSGRGMTTVDAEVWKNEIERVYNSVLDNKYLELYSEYIEYSCAVGETVYSNVSVNDVFKYIESNIKSNYTKYTTSPSSFNEDMLSNRSSVYYVMQNQDVGEYFYVSHILVKFDEDQFTALDNLLSQGLIDQTTYDDKRTEMTMATNVKSYGETVENYTVEQFYQTFKETINGAATTQDKLDLFNEYMYQYNEDTGNKNQDFDYVIGTKDSKMVESFTEAARELHEDGQIGAISDMVESEYGIHILIYLGGVENLFEVENIDNFTLTTQTGDALEQNIEKITNYKLSKLNTKTMFDLVYSQLTSNNVSILETLNLNTLKHDVKITKYPKHYSDLY